MSIDDKIKQRFNSVHKLMNAQSINDVIKVVKNNFRGGNYGPSSTMRSNYIVEDHRLMNRNWYSIKSKKETKPLGQTKIIIYLHGGAWVMETGPQQLDFSGFLVDHTGAELWFPEYPLAPEYTGLGALKMVVNLYRLALKQVNSSEIAVLGDSAGGGLATSLAMNLRDKNIQQPNNLILFSPGYDVKFCRTGEEIKYNNALLKAGLNAIKADAQPFVNALWCGDNDDHDYRLNPLFGDPRGLAPQTIFAGTAEDIPMIKYVAKAVRLGVNIHYYEKLNAVHTWVVRADQENTKERKLVINLLLNHKEE